MNPNENRSFKDMETKEALRQKIWALLEGRNIADFPRPCFKRIPNFVGSRIASEKMKEIQEFKHANCVFCAPDFVLKRIREITLKEGKVLAIALPHMTGFVEIRERNNIQEATTINGFKRFGKPLKTRVDLFIQGSVVVDRMGHRLGKGTGYGDKEWEYLLSRGLASSQTKVVTLVHDIQILKDFSSLIDEKDKRVDYILTPTQIIAITG